MKDRLQACKKVAKPFPVLRERKTMVSSEATTTPETIPSSADTKEASTNENVESLHSLRLKRLNPKVKSDQRKCLPNVGLYEDQLLFMHDFEDTIEEIAYIYGGSLRFEPRMLDIDGRSFCVEIEPEYFRYHEIAQHESLPDIGLTTAVDFLDLVYMNLYGISQTYRFVLSFAPENFPSPKRIFRGSQDHFIIEFDNGSTQHIRNSSFEPFDTCASIRALIERRNDKCKPAERTVVRTQVDEYPLKLGPLTVNDMNWSSVSFQGDSDIPFGRQKADILKAMFKLGALGPEKAKKKENILETAKLDSDMVLSKPFTARDKNKPTYKAIYDACVGYVDSSGKVTVQSKGKKGGAYFLIMQDKALV